MSKTGAFFVIVFVLIHLCFVAGIVKQNVLTMEVNQSKQDRTFSSNVAYNATMMDNKKMEMAGGLVSIDCLRCLCLFSSNCEPVGCQLINASKYCGYFQLDYLKYIDCEKPGKDLPTCADDFECSTLCVQRYVKRYVVPGNCSSNCEGFARLLFGGPGECNNPATMAPWAALQQVPGCKGVQ